MPGDALQAPWTLAQQGGPQPLLVVGGGCLFCGTLPRGPAGEGIEKSPENKSPGSLDRARPAPLVPKTARGQQATPGRRAPSPSGSGKAPSTHRGAAPRRWTTHTLRPTASQTHTEAHRDPARDRLQSSPGHTPTTFPWTGMSGKSV